MSEELSHEEEVEQAKANAAHAEKPGNEVKETSGGGGSDPDSSATGAGPSGGADTGTTGGDADSSATGAGPSGGA